MSRHDNAPGAGWHLGAEGSDELLTTQSLAHERPAPSPSHRLGELTTAVRVALRACALVVVEEDPERRRALAEAGVRKIRAAIEREKREDEARAALEAAADRLGSGGR